ncbi:MAG: T9SS type A sorting domain-containing protein [Cytophagales bacterium]
MKRFFYILFIVVLATQLKASHLITTHIQISHLQNFDYELKVVLYTDPQAVPAPQSISVSSYQRQGATFIQSFNLSKDTSYTSPSSNVGCPPTLYDYDMNVYISQINLAASTYNHAGGYLFQYNNCCRSGGIHNIQNPTSSGSSGLLLFPPVVDGSGNQIINSSPVLNDPVNEVIVNQHPFYNFYGGFDPDGDSIAYHLYTPFGGNTVSAGTVNPISSPYPDPSTQVAPVSWAIGYSVNDQIHGMGTNPSSNRFQIDPLSGMANLYADETSPGYVIVGVWSQEFRNGQLIGSTFRDFVYFVSDSVLTPNNPPDLSVQTQSLASWNGDTLEFSGSPVCVQVEVTDQDDIADISLYVGQSDYDESDYNFVQSSAIVQGQDTFITALCFQPDSFLSYPSKVVLIAMDDKCYESTFDTLEFYIRFNSYSNAGSGGNVSIPITPSLGNLDLYSYLGGSPNPGGTWLDLDNSGLISNGIFDAGSINSDITYRVAYIDQQPNYPADTAELELAFFVVQSLGEGLDESEVKIYPNPSSANVTFEVSDDFIGNTVSVYTLDSREVQRFILESNTNSISIEKSGMYLIKIGGKPGVHKLFIEN